jgi:hypothetical protein
MSLEFNMKTQSCPICDAQVPPLLKYPSYVCNNCATRASSIDERRLKFFNLELSDGYAAEYTEASTPYASHKCFIDGIRCYAKSRDSAVSSLK